MQILLAPVQINVNKDTATKNKWKLMGMRVYAFRCKKILHIVNGICSSLGDKWISSPYMENLCILFVFKVL